MKKMISMLMMASMALFAVSCDKSDDGSNDGGDETQTDAYANSGDKYMGALDVDFWNTFMPVPAYVDLSEQDDVTYYAKVNDDETITITLANVSFCPEPYDPYLTTGMPAMDIVLPNIAFESSADGTTSYYAAECDPTTLDGFEFATVIESITEVAIKIDSDNKLYVEFNCGIYVNEMDLEFNVYFNGPAAE